MNNIENMFSVPSLPGETEANIWENWKADQSKPEMQMQNSHKLCLGFYQAMKAQRTCFISLVYKIILFCLNKEKDDI